MYAKTAIKRKLSVSNPEKVQKKEIKWNKTQ
jgi:hypothetical protein